MSLSANEFDSFLQTICESNGISEERFVHNNESITRIEMFMYNITHLRGFDRFRNLRQLEILQQTISSVSELNGLDKLCDLTISETNVESIQSLNHLTSLERLNLSCNKITSLEGLSSLSRLEHLWLHENKIQSLHGISNNTRLRILNIAANRIKNLQQHLDCLNSLEKCFEELNHEYLCQNLNLAANKICHYDDLEPLSALPNLSTLCFSDPNFGANPICSYPNYVSVSLGIVRQIRVFDGNSVTEEMRMAAQISLLKRRMYCNLRAKVVHRLAEQQIVKHQKIIQEKIETLDSIIKQSSVYLHELEYASYISSKPACEHLYFSKFKAPLPTEPISEIFSNLQNFFRNRFRQIEDLSRRFIDFSASMKSTRDILIRRLQIEIETAGSVRFEDLSPKDALYQLCNNYLRVFFDESVFAAQRIVGIHPLRIVRLYSKNLRQKLEALNDMPLAGNSTGRQFPFEYMIFPLEHAAFADVVRLMEGGFMDKQDFDQAVSPVSLFRSLHAFDMRTGLVLDHWKSRRQLLLVRVYMRKHPLESIPLHTVRAGKTAPTATPTSHHDGDLFMETSLEIPGSKTYLVYEDSILIPEFYVEYNYIQTKNEAYSRSKGLLASSQSTSSNLKTSKSLNSMAPSMSDLGVTDNLNHNFHTTIKQIFQTIADSFMDDLDKVLEPFEGLWSKVQKLTKIGISFFPKPIMSSEVLLQAVDTGGLEMLVSINLNNSNVKKIDALAGLSQLRYLLLANNQISSLEFLNDLPRLERLDLGFNSIIKLAGLKGLPNLITLSLEYNHLKRLEEVNYLKRFLPHTKALLVRGNPFSAHRDYVAYIVKRMDELEFLDENPVSPTMGESAAEISFTLLPNAIKEAAYSRIRSFPMTSSLNWQLPYPSHGRNTDTWWRSVVELDLSHGHIRKLANLEKLAHMRRLNLTGNQITKIEGLDSCVALEDLLLAENKISKIENIFGLTNLQKLDLSSNEVHSLSTFERLPITQLSIDCNHIVSLKGIMCLENLIEIYAGNNHISCLKEISNLRPLANLLILDIAGNPVEQEPDARLFSIFQLRKLKILDGLPIDASELNDARGKYNGRLTTDLLTERIGVVKFQQIKVLDISNCNVKEIESIRGSEFEKLVELNLEKNSLENLSGLHSLTTLTKLRLAYNKLEPSSLCFHHNSPAESWGLLGMTSLLHLDLSFNFITNLSSCHLQHLWNLKTLLLEGNQIAKLDAIEALPTLKELDLRRNKLRSIDGVTMKQLSSLEILILDDNLLKSCFNLHLVPTLSKLSISSNRVTDLSDLDGLQYLHSVDLTISHNPVVRRPMFRLYLLHRFQYLTSIDGKAVSDEERDRANGYGDTLESYSSFPALNQEPQPKPPTGKASIRIQALGFDQTPHFFALPSSQESSRSHTERHAVFAPIPEPRASPRVRIYQRASSIHRKSSSS